MVGGGIWTSHTQFQDTQEFSKLIDYLGRLRATEFGKLTVNYIALVNAPLSGKYLTLKTLHALKLTRAEHIT